MSWVFEDRLTGLVSSLESFGEQFHFRSEKSQKLVGKWTFLAFGVEGQKGQILNHFFRFSEWKRNCSPKLSRDETRPVSRSSNTHDIGDKVWRLLKKSIFWHFLALKMPFPLVTKLCGSALFLEIFENSGLKSQDLVMRWSNKKIGRSVWVP